MRSGVERRLKLWVSVLVFLGYFALTMTYQYGQTLLLIPVLAVGFMPIGEGLDRRFGWYRQVTSFGILVFILSIPIIIQVYDLLDAVVSVVIFAQIYSLIHTKRERNYGHMLLLSFFLVLAALVLSPQPGIGLGADRFQAFLQVQGVVVIGNDDRQVTGLKRQGRPLHRLPGGDNSIIVSHGARSIHRVSRQIPFPPAEGWPRCQYPGDKSNFQRFEFFPQSAESPPC